jgi:hypothetical protein
MENSILAYVFWHWSRPEVGRDQYERRQRAFHAALAAAPPNGFRASFSVALAGAPWTAQGGAAYEDWYLVQDFGALGLLNDAAVSASRAAPHDAAAAVAGGGAGGLYRLKQGTVMQQPAVAHWFSKPDGMSYRDLFNHLGPVVERFRGALWMRQLVLGPAREFCLHAVNAVPLAAAFRALVVPLRAVWPEGAGS